MNRFLKLIGITILVMIGGKLIGKVVGGAIVQANQASHSEGIPELTADFMAEVASEAKREVQLPQEAESGIELYDITGGERSLTYHVRITQAASTDIDPIEFSDGLHSDLAASVCRNVRLQSLIEAGASIVYHFVGNDNGRIAETTIRPSDCDVTPTTP